MEGKIGRFIDTMRGKFGIQPRVHPVPVEPQAETALVPPPVGEQLLSREVTAPQPVAPEIGVGQTPPEGHTAAELLGQRAIEFPTGAQQLLQQNFPELRRQEQKFEREEKLDEIGKKIFESATFYLKPITDDCIGEALRASEQSDNEAAKDALKDALVKLKAVLESIMRFNNLSMLRTMSLSILEGIITPETVGPKSKIYSKNTLKDFVTLWVVAQFVLYTPDDDLSLNLPIEELQKRIQELKEKGTELDKEGLERLRKDTQWAQAFCDQLDWPDRA